MRLTKQTGHAIRLLIECADAGNTLVKVAVLAERLDITQQNLFKIVHILSHAGFIAAMRGPKGGVKLARPAGEIRIGDVVRATEVTAVEVEDETPRGRKRGNGSAQASPINSIFDDALEAFVSVLDQYTLADMASAPAGLLGTEAPHTARHVKAVAGTQRAASR